jgi:sRNA-binding protein
MPYSKSDHTKVNPTIALLTKRYPHLFVPEPWMPHKPLMIGIHRAILEQTDITPTALGPAMRTYVTRRMYQEALVGGGARYSLDGAVAGDVSPSEQAQAQAWLAAHDVARAGAMAAGIAARKEQQKKPFRRRKVDTEALAAARAKQWEQAWEKRRRQRQGKPQQPPRDTALLQSTVQPAAACVADAAPAPRRLGLGDLKRLAHERRAREQAGEAA